MKDKKKRERNATSTTFFTTFLQKILNSKLLQVVIDGKKSNSSSRFKLESVTI